MAHSEQEQFMMVTMMGTGDIYIHSDIFSYINNYSVIISYL